MIAHIMTSGSVLHNSGIIDFINNSSEVNRNNHIFYVKDVNVYNSNKKYKNVIFESKINEYKCIKRIMNDNEGCIIHGLSMGILTLYLLSSRLLKRTVWIVWGHDLYVTQKSGGIKSKVRNIIVNMLWNIKSQRIKNLKAIGIGFKYDAYRIIDKLGIDFPILNMPYFSINQNDLVNKYMPKKKENKTIKIMIGHSAYPFLNHIEILNKLKSYRNKDVCISLVLAYGYEDYAKSVIDYAYSIFEDDKIEIINKSLSFEEYLEYLDSVDIAIFDQKHQSALGNFYLLCFFGKKLYLNSKGILNKACIMEGIESYDCESIGKIDYNEFIQPINDTNKNVMYNFSQYYFSNEIAENNWKVSLHKAFGGEHE